MATFRLPHAARMMLLTVLVVGTLVGWAFPQDLPLWRGMAIVTGWIGCGLLLCSLLLMIREPWLASLLGGLEAMYRWHHRLGVAAYLFFLLHPLALVADAWGPSASVAWSAVAPWHQDWPVWLGWAALLCMMGGLAASFSARQAYATWRKLHHLLTLSVVLAAAHLVLLGLELQLVLAPLSILLLLLWRLVRADFGWAAQPYVVHEVMRQTPDMVEVTLRPLAHAIAARPGQFVVVAFFNGPDFAGCGEYHPFTLSSIHPGGQLALAIKALGDCTRHVQSVQVGTAVRVQGPFGEFLTRPVAGPSVWLAGGIGITPFLARLRSGPQTQPVWLVYLYRTTADAAYVEELQALCARQPQLHMTTVVGDGVPDWQALLLTHADLEHPNCFLCGPVGMVNAAVAALRQRGVPLQNIHFERFDFR